MRWRRGGLISELSSDTHSDLGGRQSWEQTKMVVHLLEGRENVGPLSERMRVCNKAPPFRDRL